MSATAYNTVLRSGTNPLYSGGTMRISVTPNGFPASVDTIAIACVITGGNGNSPIPPTSVAIPTDGSSAFIEIAFPANFTATNYQVTLGTGGNSTTLGLPIAPSVFNTAVLSPVPAPAQGSWLSESGLLAFLGQTNLTIISGQSNAAIGNNSTGIQSAINWAESRITGRLLTLQATPGVSFFAYPFFVGNQSIGAATTSIAYNSLTLIGNMYCTKLLGIWRMLNGISEDGGDAMAKTIDAFGGNGDSLLTSIIKWAEGYTECGQYIDLNLNAGATVGSPCRTLQLPKHGRAGVNPSGAPAQFVTDGPYPWYGWPTGYGFYPGFGAYGWGL